jgi:hypothetical protein
VQVGDLNGGRAVVDEGEALLERGAAAHLADVNRGSCEGQVGAGGRGGRGEQDGGGKKATHDGPPVGDP